MRRIGLDGKVIYQFGPYLEGADVRGGGEPPADDSDLDKREDLGDAGKAAIKAERAARRQAAADLKASQDALKTTADRLKALEDAEEKRNKDAATAAEKEREQRGEFETLAKTRETERDQARDELKALREQFDALKTAANKVVKADFESLPEAVRDVYTGGQDDPVAMLDFIPKGKKLVDALAKQDGDGTGNGKTDSSGIAGAKPNPDPKGTATTDRSKEDEAALLAFRANYH